MEDAAGSKGITFLRWISAFIMALAVLPAMSATAVTIPPNPPAPTFTTGMEIDGDKTTAGGFDWDQILGATPPGPYSGVDFDSTGIVGSTFEEDANGSGGICNGDDASANPTSQFPDSNSSTVPPGGSNFNGWQIGPTTLQDKVDACTGAAALEIVDIDSAGYHQLHYVLYQYWTRHPEGTGSIVFFTVLEGPAAGRCDDYLIKFDFDPSGGSGTFTSQSWVPSSGNCADPYGAGQWVDSGPAATTSVSFAGQNVYATDQGDPSGAQDSTFAESAVDLTSLGIIPSNRCVTFSASGFFTQTGNEGQLQDFVQYSDPLTLSNCNSLSVAKESDPAGLTSPSTFQYRIRQSDNGPIHDASLIGPGDTDGSVTTITSDIAIGDTDVWHNVIGQTDYLVEELATPAGWTLATIECTYLDVLGNGDGVATPGQPGFKTATIYANGAPTGQDFDIFSPALAPAPECVITNETSGIQIVKDAVPNAAQDFAFTGDLGSFSLDDDPADSTLANSQLFTGLAAGTYAVTETGAAGWDLTNLTCDDPSGNTTINPSTATIDLAAGELVTCTFTNTRKSSTLTLQKAWVNGAAGDTAAISADGVSPASSATSTSTGAASEVDATNTVTVTMYAGEQVTLAEVLGGANSGSYGTTLDCDGVPVVLSDPLTGIYTVPDDPQPVTCTFTNARLTTTVVLQKHWIDAAQGDTAGLEAAGSQGSPTATSTASGAANRLDTTNVVTLTALTGETVALSEALGVANAGVYDVALACDGGALTYNGGPSGSLQVPKAADGTTTCTFTNTAGRGTVIIRKDVAGADSTFDFTGTWAGATTFDVTTSSGAGQAVFSGVLVGTYSVSEVVPAGYDLMSVDCVDEDGGSTDVGFVGTLEVDAGETVLCTFTNAQLGPLDITKTVSSGPTLLSGTTYRITYDIVVTSQSFRAETFDLTDIITFGAGVTVVSAQVAAPPTVTTVAGWTGSAGNTLLVDDGTIAPLGSITLTVTVDAEVGGTTTSTSRDCQLAEGESGTGFLNAATVAWENGTDTDDDCAVVPSADVSVVKTATPTEVVVQPGGEDPVVTWTMVVTNNGPNDAAGVVLDDTVPNGFSSIVVSTATGACSINGQAVHCDLGTLAVGESVTVTVNATVTTESAGVYRNVVVVGSASPVDPDLTNNTDEADVTVDVVAVLPPTLPPTTPSPTTPSPTVPPPTVPPTPPPTLEQLPVTGGSTAGLQLWAVVALALGFLAITASRRGRSRRARS